MGNHRPDPEDELVWSFGRAEVRGASGARHLSRERRELLEHQPWVKPGRLATARCGTSGWFAGAAEPEPTGVCQACFRDLPV